jgi:hypothetical protein
VRLVSVRLRRTLGAALILALMALTSGCAAMSVRPWDRDLLSQKKMRFNPSRTEHATDDHIYFSKEGSTGGSAVGGGGCGCN